MHSWVLYYFQSICSYCKYKHTNKRTTCHLILHAFYMVLNIAKSSKYKTCTSKTLCRNTVLISTLLEGHPSKSCNTQPLKCRKNWICLAENNSWRHWRNITTFQNPKVGYLEDSTEVCSEKTKDNGYKPKQWQLGLEIKKRCFTMRIINLWAGCSERQWNR